MHSFGILAYNSFKMDSRTIVLRLVLWILCLGLVFTVPLRLFYPYGPSRQDEVLRNIDDHSSTEIQLRTPINYFANLFTSVFVSIYQISG